MIGWRVQLPLIAVAVVAAVVPVPAALVEQYYSTLLFPLLQRGMTAASNLAPIAVIDVAIVVVGVWVIFQIAGAFLLRKRFGWIGGIARSLLNIATAAAIVYLIFLVMWGLNYRRVSIPEKVPFDANRISPAALLALAHRTVDEVNRLHASAHTGDAMFTAVGPALAAAFGDAERVVGVDRPALAGRPKKSLLDAYFLRAGVDGMTDPFFLETLVASDLRPFERPHVVAHEWAHLAGFANEGEANFVGWLTCLRAPDSSKYSGWLFLYTEVMASLPPADRTTVANRLAEGPRADLRAIAERVRRNVRPFVAAAGWRVYDQYLKANRVDAGVRSYGEVVRLVLGVRLE